MHKKIFFLFTEKKSFSTAYTGDDDINDVAAMGGVNLAEETQKILGSTEYVGTQIRSCKEEIMCSMGPLQLKVRTIYSPSLIGRFKNLSL